MHQVGVLHRDIKPSNVLLEGRAPVLIDFGLARLAEDPRLTHTGWLLGTPGYLAPEILYGDDATTASDVHSWAATVVFAATGRPPFGTGPAMAIMDRVRRGEHDLSARAAGAAAAACRPAWPPTPTTAPARRRCSPSLRRPGARRPRRCRSGARRRTMPFALAAPRHADDDATDAFGAAPATAHPPADRRRRCRSRPAAPYMQPPAPQRGPRADMQPPPPTGRAAAWSPPGRVAAGRRRGLPRLQRGALLLGLFAVVTLGFARAPYLALAVACVAALAVRTVSWTTESARQRQHLRGAPPLVRRDR